MISDCYKGKIRKKVIIMFHMVTASPWPIVKGIALLNKGIRIIGKIIYKKIE